MPTAQTSPQRSSQCRSRWAGLSSGLVVGAGWACGRAGGAAGVGTWWTAERQPPQLLSHARLNRLQFGWEPSWQGLILSMFFLGYLLTQLLGGEGPVLFYSFF